MTIEITLLSFEQHADVAAATSSFTCRGPRHADDPTVAFGDAFLRDGVWADLDRAAVTRTWAAIVEHRLAGYVALAASEIVMSRREQRNAALEQVRFSRYGCVQIVMLAVHADLQARRDLHVGTALLEHAQLVAATVGAQVGARFLAADVNPPARGFYERCGFLDLHATTTSAHAD